MLQTLPTRTATPRLLAARLPSCRPSRAFICRSTTPDSAAASVSTAEQSSEDVKVKSTLSALDSLLGPTATAAPTPSRPAPPAPSSSSSSGTASTSGRPAESSWPSAAPSSPAAPAAPARKTAGLTFDQVMGFSGLAPEVINGRAAMIGFFLAISAELKNGESVFAQMVSGGAAQALVVIVAVTVASFAPAILGAPLDRVFNKDPKQPPTEWGPFTALAEGLNGRAAMLGLALLLFFEGAGSNAFFM